MAPRPERPIDRLLAAAGYEDVAALRTRGALEPERLWRHVLELIDLEWAHVPTATLDDEMGTPWSRWFADGRLNAVATCLDRHVDARPDAAAVVWEGCDGATCRWSFRELHAATDAIAARLLDGGVASGQAVGVYLSATPECVAALLAAAKLGAVAVPLSASLEEPELAERLRCVRAVALVTAELDARDSRGAHLAATGWCAAQACPQLHTVVAVARGGRARVRDTATVRTRILESEHPLFVAFLEDSLDAGVYVHGGWLAQSAAMLALHTGCGPGDVVCWPAEIGQIAFPWHVFGALAHGAAIGLCEAAVERPRAGGLWRFARRHDVSILALTPVTAAALRAGEAPRDAAPRALRTLVAEDDAWDRDAWTAAADAAACTGSDLVRLVSGPHLGGPVIGTYPTEVAELESLGGAAFGIALDVVDVDGRSLREELGELVSPAPWPAMTRGLLDAPLRFLVHYWSRHPETWAHGVSGVMAGDRLVPDRLTDPGAATTCLALSAR
ncbi:MAG TPA: AMP-binding protein [Conexibacter sp.]|nr:AMP-binding protein [Conexibacter sp.]